MKRHYPILMLGGIILLLLSACSSTPKVKPVSVNKDWEFFRTKENASVLLVRKKLSGGKFFYQIASEDPNFLGRYMIWHKGRRPQPLGKQIAFERQVDFACRKNNELPATNPNSDSTFVLETKELVNTDSLIELVKHYFPTAREDEDSIQSLFKHPGAIGATLSTIRFDGNAGPNVVAAFVDCRDPKGKRFALAQARSYSTDITISIAQYIKHVIRYKRRRGDQIGDKMTAKDRASLNSSAIYFLVRGLRSYASNQDRYARWLRSKESANSLQRYSLEDNINAYNLIRDLTRLNGERSDQMVRAMEFKYNRERTKFPKEMPKISRKVSLRHKDLKRISAITNK